MDNQNEKQVQESSNTEIPVEQSSSTEPVVEENAAPVNEKEPEAEPSVKNGAKAEDKPSGIGQFFGRVKNGIVSFFGKVKDGLCSFFGKVKDGICSLSQTQKIVIFSVIGVIITSLLVFGIVKICQNRNDNAGKYFEDGNLQNTIEYEGDKYARKNLVNFLIMGVDANSEADSNPDASKKIPSADFLALVSIDVFNGSYTILNLNRNIITDIDVVYDLGDKEKEKKQLGMAYHYGDGFTSSCENTAKAVSNLLNGLRIDYYISLTMPAVGILSEEVGGVEITFDKDYTDINPEYVKDATVTLTGAAALEFVRARQGVETQTNEDRMARQQLYIDAFIKQLAKTGSEDSKFLSSAFKNVSDYTVTNCDLNTCSRLFGYMSEYTCLGNRGLDGEASVNEATGLAEFKVDDASKKLLILEWFYNKLSKK